ncbi:MAG: carbonic anhydrase family protein [Rhodocyclaceae bacterium]|nr:carbonic anhydrase family protein [Rhodocyclaceae bacterium]
MQLRTLPLGLALLAASCLSLAHDHSHGHGHWGYEEHKGPHLWGELDPAFTTCKHGKEQSPINITATKKSAKLKPIAFNYKAGAAEIVNNGHTIQINLADGGSIKLGDEEFKLLQFHFHTPSEEQVDGRHFPMVAHLVHKSADGKLAVVAVLLELGQENAALREAFSAMPAQAGEKQDLAAGFNTADLLPQDRSYYAFQGSLTTPPCSEGVRWQVLRTPVQISVGQFAAFKGLYPMNARPVQPLHGRRVMSTH